MKNLGQVPYSLSEFLFTSSPGLHIAALLVGVLAILSAKVISESIPEAKESLKSKSVKKLDMLISLSGPRHGDLKSPLPKFDD